MKLIHKADVVGQAMLDMKDHTPRSIVAALNKIYEEGYYDGERDCLAEITGDDKREDEPREMEMDPQTEFFS